MASQSQIDAFVNTYAPYAETAAAQTGLNAQLILAQWGNETNYGTHFTEKNNIGNVGVYGGGPNPSFATVADGVQAYINEINSPVMASVKATAGQSLQAQAAALGASGYAGGHYNDGGGPGSSLLADSNVIASAGFGATTSVPQANIAGAASSSGAANAPATPATATSTVASTADKTSFILPGSNIPGFDPKAQTEEANSSDVTALTQLEGNFTAYGFNSQQAGALTQWAWQEYTHNVDPTQIAIDLQTPGTQGYTIFQQVFPGFVQANAELNAIGQPAMSVNQYQQYQTQAEQAAHAAGLPPGFINSNNIGAFIGQGISSTELSQRITDASVLAYQSTPEQQKMFNQYFGLTDSNPYLGANQNGSGGLTTGQIASIFLDPITAEPILRNQLAAAQLGGAGVTAGIGAISETEAMQIAQAYGASPANGSGTSTGGLSQSQINSAVGNVAPFAPLETARPGMGGEAAQGTITPDQLIGTQLLPTAANTRQLQTAQEVAKAPFSGGGGYVQNTKGTGVGSGSSSGAGQ
jgi:hypothetical protein